MPNFVWNIEKAASLKSDRLRSHVSFEDCVLAIESGKTLDDIPNPSAKYPHQRMFVLDINNYAYAVPYLTDGDVVFFKTLFPSRKYTVIYLKEKRNEH